MEQFGLPTVLMIVKEFGIPGLVLLLWYLSMKSQNKMLDAYREDTKAVIEVFEKKYDNNIILVKSVEKIASDQKDLITTNTEALTRLSQTLRFNRLCPNVKIEMGDG